MAIHLAECQIHENATVLDALRALNASGEGIALCVAEDGVLVGLLTDGDIRRALLGGVGLNDRVGSFLCRNFVSVSSDTPRTDVLEIMQARLLRHVPIIDTNGQLLGLHLLNQLLGRKNRPNWAVIMAGGKGTRLRPITEALPKPMVKVAGRPILERLVLHVVGCGIRRIFLSVNYMGHVIEDHFGDGSRFGCRIDYLRETQPLGTGGALSLLPEVPNDPLLVLNGDLVVQENLGDIVDYHASKSFLATMAVREYCHQVPFGCVEVESGRIVGLEEKPVLHRLINAGIYVLSAAAIKSIPGNQFFPITELFSQALIEGLSCGCHQLNGEWTDVGSHSELSKARGLA